MTDCINEKFLTEIEEKTYDAACELIKTARLQAHSILVVGCSSSEITGGMIGKASSPAAAEAVFSGIMRAVSGKDIFVAAQCCEHLNRALITEREAIKYMSAPVQPVNVVPQPKAGGSFASAAYRNMTDPVAIEEICADAGLDIGSTLIGMHLKRVAVPVRLGVKKIGEAAVTAARVRPKFIGGSRAVYDENLL